MLISHASIRFLSSIRLQVPPLPIPKPVQIDEEEEEERRRAEKAAAKRRIVQERKVCSLAFVNSVL